MENLKFIDPLLHGIKPDILEKKFNLSPKHLVCAGVSSLLIGAVLKKAGKNKTAALIGSIALPLLASACYKKLANFSNSKKELNENSGIEYNH